MKRRVPSPESPVLKPRRLPDPSVIPKCTPRAARVEPSLDRDATVATEARTASPLLPERSPTPASARTALPTLESLVPHVDASPHLTPEEPELVRNVAAGPEPELPTGESAPAARPALMDHDHEGVTVLFVEPAAVPPRILAKAHSPAPAHPRARALPELRASRRGAALSRLDAHLQAANRFLDRYPWLMPSVSFSVGWVSFFLFQRGESLARGIAVIALLGWPWLFAENLIGRWVVARSNGRLSVSAVRFVTQQIQQEILFFAVPFLFGAMVLEPGQMLFVGVAAVVAILVSLDPIYLHRIAPHAGLSSALHAYCTLIAALVVLPVALHIPLDEALPLSMAITALSLLLSLPRMLIAAPNNRARLLGCAVLAAVFPLTWASRAMIPPAGLWVREARITDRIDGLEPGRAIPVFGTGSLHLNGSVAFVAVRAPTGLSQEVVFDWHREGELIDRIPAQISGGREAGFRTYSRKQNFPEDSRGHWRVDLRTPQGQLIARMRFEVN